MLEIHTRLKNYYILTNHLFKERLVKTRNKPLKNNSLFLISNATEQLHEKGAKKESGGAKRDRTADLLRARQALSQLSYSPDASTITRIAEEYWWVWVDLNHRPHPYQGCALTN